MCVHNGKTSVFVSHLCIVEWNGVLLGARWAFQQLCCGPLNTRYPATPLIPSLSNCLPLIHLIPFTHHPLILPPYRNPNLFYCFSMFCIIFISISWLFKPLPFFFSILNCGEENTELINHWPVHSVYRRANSPCWKRLFLSMFTEKRYPQNLLKMIYLKLYTI